MQLEFEIVKNVGVGNYPDIIHFANTQAQIFSITGGELYGVPTDKIDYGEWEDVVLQNESKISPDINMSHFEVKVLPGWGIIGGYKAEDIHKMIIYEFAWEMGQYLNSGNIKYSNDPVSSFTLSLENPDEKNPEKPGNVAVSEESSLLSPGAKVVFKFSAGDSEEYELGTFYVDRSNFTLTSETASVDGRNLIGKALKEQTLDEHTEYWYNSITNIITQILTNANLVSEQFLVENVAQENWFTFGPTTSPFKAIEDIRNLMVDWKIEEQTDGTIVVGSPTFNGFASRGTYSFYRNKDIFSRQVVRDDAEVYNRVCIHTEGFAIAVYRDIASYEGWNLQGNKTMYIQVANSTRLAQVEAYADEVAMQVGNVGKIESFVGPFRPQLMCGDEAVIIGENGYKSLGLITEIAHNFGKSGFYTNFTVDSGGKLGKGRLSEFIKKIAAGDTGAGTEIGYSDIDLSDYRNLASEGKMLVSSSFQEKRHPITLMSDGLNDTVDGWWGNDTWDDVPWVVWDFGERCRIDKILLYFDCIERVGTAYPRYKVDYWNGSFWVEIFATGLNTERFYEASFDYIETSRLRLTTPEENMTIYEWEIHGWG